MIVKMSNAAAQVLTPVHRSQKLHHQLLPGLSVNGFLPFPIWAGQVSALNNTRGRLSRQPAGAKAQLTKRLRWPLPTSEGQRSR